MKTDTAFNITPPPEHQLGDTLLVGLSHLGMAGLTAVDYLIRQLDSEQIGHISPTDLPAIAPFQNGEPRHHTRLYSIPNSNLSVLVGELFIPIWAARSFTDALVDWTASSTIEEIAILHGVPFPHGPEEHTVFHVSTPSYRDHRLGQTDIKPLSGGFLDGVAGEIVTRSLDTESPPVGVFITPAHPPGPDIDASLLLLEAIQEIYGFSVDEAELRQASEELKQYYTELTDHMQSLGEAEQPLASRDFPEDRMYM